ncbi:MAG: crossover junction endodeoxyribonuclease RuvC, partial [Bacteroidales bacterium]|nr:crossover junction endodeoxyribonuclease RuvC [Bacteroidales bacterium]
VAIAAALHAQIPVFEYAPTKIKAAVTGRNNSSKEQVAAMLQYIFQIEAIPTFDATDALAIAYCHYLQQTNTINSQSKTTKSNSWERFVENNKDRIIK